MLLAARALQEAARDTRLTVAGRPHAGELTRVVRPDELAAGPMAIVNESAASVDAVVSVLGSALTPEPPISRGFTIERSYHRLDGEKVDIASADGGSGRIAQNQRLVAVVRISGAQPGGRVLVVDRLPAGFEIENPRLVESGDLKGLEIAKGDVEPEHTEFRDDRFVAAFDFQGNGGRRGEAAAKPVTATVAYIVRAVTPGSYVHPAATVEDMYRPERFARTAAGTLEVTPQQ